jgi:two-component system alkaline phosphatase synthesis response regulator PhoP
MIFLPADFIAIIWNPGQERPSATVGGLKSIKNTRNIYYNGNNLNASISLLFYVPEDRQVIMTRKILVVDDEPQIVKVLQLYLDKAGFQVVTAPDGLQALALFGREKPDFIILDLNLPGMDGMDVCKAVRKESNVPILMLTARVEEADRLVGLELGADDYVVKPFSPREVVARVRTIFRRSDVQPAEGEVLRIDELEIDLEKHTVREAGRLVELTPTEFNLLVTMARKPRRVFSRLQLMEQSQGDAYEGYERTIDAHIKNLRMKLEPDARKPKYIQTVFGLGYKLEVAGDEN